MMLYERQRWSGGVWAWEAGKGPDWRKWGGAAARDVAKTPARSAALLPAALLCR